MDATLKIARVILALALAAYLALAVRNNCAPPGQAPPPAMAPAPCKAAPTRLPALPEDAPPAARQVLEALASQLRGSALLGHVQGEWGPGGLVSDERKGLLIVPEARSIDGRPFVALAVVRQCTGRVIGAAGSYVDRLSAPGSAAYLRSQLTTQPESAGARVFFAELLLEPTLPEGFALEVRAQLRRAALGSPVFDWYEPDLSERLGLGAARPGSEDFRLYVRAGGTRAELWTLTQLRGPGGEQVLAERHELGLRIAESFRTLPALAEEAARALRKREAAP